MSKLPSISGRECARVLENLGWIFKRQKGSHMMYHNNEKRLVIPDHDELDRGTLRAIIRSAGITVEEFLEQL